MSDSEDEDDGKKPYRVGYKKPPKESQFTSEYQPNKPGTRKGIPNFQKELREFLTAKVWLSINGKRTRATRWLGLIYQLYSYGATTNLNAGFRLMELALKMPDTGEEVQPFAELTAADEQILAEFVQRSNANAAAAAPAKPKGKPKSRAKRKAAKPSAKRDEDLSDDDA